MRAGLILFAHGARDPRWAEPFEAIAERIRARRPGLPGRAGLPRADGARPRRGRAAGLAAGGATRIDVVPLFLGTGGHLRNDLPPLVEALRAALPAVELHLHPAIGENEAVIAVVASAALAAPASVNNPRLRVRVSSGAPSGPRAASPCHEPPPVPVRPGSGPPQPQPDRDRQGAVHLAARRLQGDPRARGASWASTSSPATASGCAASPSPGQQVLKSIEVIMREVGNLKRIGEEFSQQDAGTLSIATTHTPGPLRAARAGRADCAKRFPKVNVSLHQGTPEQVARMVLDEVADIGLATESLADYDELVTLPCYEWQHVLVLPPAIRWRRWSGSRWRTWRRAADLLSPVVHRAQAHRRTRSRTRKLKPNIVLEAIDSDVIKTYVRLGLGIGIVAEMAMRDDGRNGDLVARPAGHLFGQNVARVAFKRGAYLRNFVYAFAETAVRPAHRALIAARHGRRCRHDYQL